MKNLNLLLSLLFLSSSAFAQGSGSHGGGEDGVFKNIRDEISGWMEKNDQLGLLKQKLELSSISGNNLKNTFNIATTAVGDKVIFNHEVIHFGSNVRICKNENLAITCNIDEWNATAGNTRYMIVLHEYLGVAGIETNIENDYSRYPISPKILGYVKSKTSFELGMEKVAEVYVRAKDENFLFSCKDIAKGYNYDGRIRDGKMQIELSDGHIILYLKSRSIFSKKSLMTKIVGDADDRFIFKMRNGDSNALIPPHSRVNFVIPTPIADQYDHLTYLENVGASHTIHLYGVFKISGNMSCDVNYENLKKVVHSH